MSDHEHEWGAWFERESLLWMPGDVTKSRWCECGAYELWTKDPITTSRDLSYRVEDQS